MRLLRLGQDLPLKEKTVVCLGFFDGVHIGHRELIERAVSIGAHNRLKVCVHTFDTMPVRVINPDADVLELTPLAEKALLLEALGVDILAVSAFDGEVMHMRAKAFFHDILLEKLSARHIVAGFHHRFGYRGEGDVAMLADMCSQAGIGLDVVQPVTLPGGELISSTAIRQAIRAGDIARAERMLGRSWRG
ncbi:hypothetical protein LJC74_09225 [Eubacteriales bacterium OttesenSCG-928-A19]|nr:hypothetical protein [Eubacteriales bacterium OttesenSCG-928-A19]